MNKTKVLPIVPLRDGPVFPFTDVPLVFNRAFSVFALKNAAETDRLIFITAQKKAIDDKISLENVYETGTICQIKHMFQSDKEINVLVTGLIRAKIIRWQEMKDFSVVEVEEVPDASFDPKDPEITTLSAHVINAFQSAVRLGRGFDLFVMMKLSGGLGPAELANQMAQILDFDAAQRQALLEEVDVKKRLQIIIEQLIKEINVLELERKILTSSQAKFEKSYRENILKERKKAIEQELGEIDDELSELKELEKKAKAAHMPEDVLKKTLKEIKRLERISSANPESGYIRTYIDWLLDLPWKSEPVNGSDLNHAKKVLDEDHYGLEKIKERIIEYLAVLKLKNAKKKLEAEENLPPASPSLPKTGRKKTKPSTPTILCFVGPPGVGKTSIGKSIARALNRKFVRVSLGGVRDEAEIRGHRRTYVGAMPGRIIQGIKQAGAKNPVFMLDEIDKIGSDFRGDPSAALLEALDPEQNSAYSDHYLEVPYDLSEVVFITTANVLETIPAALLDRLEVIHFPGYTAAEKLQIAKQYLIPKQIEASGLQANQVNFTDKALETIISRYTKEAGVRNLEREIAAVCRKVARKVAQSRKISFDKTVEITPSNLNKYLGPYKFTSTLAEIKDEIGLATGLFWTQAGGGILLIEVAVMPGKGHLTLTGHLGDVMQESARAALSFVRSRWQELGLEEKLFQKIDIHVHVPEGAIPKDGPSAGIAITTALTSALTKIPVRRYVGMTGEVTLRGRVLEIGGVKEKVIGAHLAGIKTVILPKDNKKDLEDIPKYILQDLEFRFVENMDQVLEIALARDKKQSTNERKLSSPANSLFLQSPSSS